MSPARGVAYPARHFGRWLQEAIRRKIAEGDELNSAVAVTRWLGHPEPTRMNKWIKGRLLPKPEDYPDLARLGRSEDKIHELVVLDRVHVLALDHGLDPVEMVKVAASIALLGGISTEELIRIVQDVDVEELERVLGAS